MISAFFRWGLSSKNIISENAKYTKQYIFEGTKNTLKDFSEEELNSKKWKKFSFTNSRKTTTTMEVVVDFAPMKKLTQEGIDDLVRKYKQKSGYEEQ